MRQVGTHSSDMVDKIRTRGTQVQYRGRPVLVVTTHPQHFQSAGAGTFCDSFYEALRLYPDVPNVRMSHEIGLEDATILILNTPSDVIEHIVFEHNTFHEGAPNTFLQAMALVREVDSAFEVHRDKQGFSSRTCPPSGPFSYEKRFWDFIEPVEKWHLVFAEWEQFDNLKTFVHFVDKLGPACTAKILDVFGNHAQFQSKKMPNDSLLFAYLNAVQRLLKDGFYPQTINADLQVQK